MSRSLVLLDQHLVAAVDEAGAEAARRAGDHLACRLGCTACCHGPFPIDALDADRLRRGLSVLGEHDPQRAQAVRERARRCLESLRPEFPGHPRSGRLDTDSPHLEAYLERHAGVPCPALDPATRGCDLYASRPLACRTFGPPVILGGEPLDPCSLCFIGTDPEAVEACRVTPDLSAEASAIDELARTGADPELETFVVCVLAD